MNKLLQELKRRNVYKETIAYLVVAWLILQVASIILPIWNTPDWVLQIIIITLGLGLPLWVIFSWNYQFTSSGIKRTINLDGKVKSSKVNRTINFVIMFALVATIILLWIRPSSVTSIKVDKLSIAVLPFTNMSDDQSNDWFSVGVTEDILTHLSKVKGLRVISRTSVMQFKNSNKSIPEIAKELDVAYIVEGSVRKQGNQVLITAQLLEANDEHVWADKYDENLIDAFKIQQEVSQKIVKQLRIYVSPEEEKSLNTSATTNVLAAELFSRGRDVADSRIGKDLERSIDLYKEAIKLDPKFAEAYAEIGNSYVLLNIYGNMSWKEASNQAKVYVKEALAINPNSARSYSVLGLIHLTEDNWDKAKEYFEKAIEINPNDATAHHHFALFLRDNPDSDAKKVLKHISEAQKLDPLSRPINQMKFNSLLINNYVEEAKTHFERTRFLYKPEELVYYEGMLNSAVKKDLTELIYSFERALKDNPKNLYFLHSLAHYYTHVMLDRDTSLEYAKRVFEIDSTNNRYIIDKIYLHFAKKEYEEADKILNDKALMNRFNPFQKIIFKHDYYAYQNNFEKALPYLEQLKPLDLTGYYYNKAWSYSRRGDRKNTYKILNTKAYQPSDRAKAQFFANLKDTDSLFYYLTKISNYAKLDFKMNSLMYINAGDEIDAYREDPRYIKIMKENFFPIEHQKGQ